MRNVGLVSRSDPVAMPRTTRDAVQELHAMLRAADLPGPYVLVGHSLGGMIVRHYASTFSRQVAGLVLVDALAERLDRQLGPDYWARYVAFQYLPLPGLRTIAMPRSSTSPPVPARSSGGKGTAAAPEAARVRPLEGRSPSRPR